MESSTTDYILWYLLGGALGVLGLGVRVVVELAKAKASAATETATERDVWPLELKRLIPSLGMAVIFGSLSAVAMSVGVGTLGIPTVVLLCTLAGYAGADLGDPYIRVFEFYKLQRETEQGAPMANIQVHYNADSYALHDIKPPTCLLTFDDKIQSLRLDHLGSFTADLPETSRVLDKGHRVHFLIKFDEKSAPVEALARVWRPEAIFLNLVNKQRLVGTIRGQRMVSLGAAGVDRDCDITCIPPASQTSGPGNCVTCKTKSGIFELCC
jgi:hypothetical protein